MYCLLLFLFLFCWFLILECSFKSFVLINCCHYYAFIIYHLQFAAPHQLWLPVMNAILRFYPEWESHCSVTTSPPLPRIFQPCEAKQLRLYLWRRWSPRDIDVIFLRCILGHGRFNKSGGTACSYLHDTAKQVRLNVS